MFECNCDSYRISEGQADSIMMFKLIIISVVLYYAHGQGNPPSAELIECTEAIWGADTNSFPDSEIEYNLAGPDLFVSVNEDRFGTGVYPVFRALLDGFNQQIGEADPNLDAEISAYLDEVMAAAPMQSAYSCVGPDGWGYVDSEAEFRDLLMQYWFQKFSRSGGAEMDSSGFEHTFQGEIREEGDELTGWHGWVRSYDTEQSGDFQYGSSEADCGDNLIQVNDFTYLGAVKTISSIWIGKSPELQFALYTVCFMTRQGQNCNIEVGGNAVTIINYTMSGVSPTTIGTVYPQC